MATDMSAKADIALLLDPSVTLEEKSAALRGSANLVEFAAEKQAENPLLIEISESYAREFALGGGLAALAAALENGVTLAQRAKKGFRIKRDAGALVLARARMRAEHEANKSTMLAQEAQQLRESLNSSAHILHENEQLKVERDRLRKDLLSCLHIQLEVNSLKNILHKTDDRLTTLLRLHKSRGIELDDANKALEREKAIVAEITKELEFQRSESMLDVFQKQVKFMKTQGSQTVDTPTVDSARKQATKCYSSPYGLRPASATNTHCSMKKRPNKNVQQLESAIAVARTTSNSEVKPKSNNQEEEQNDQFKKLANVQHLQNQIVRDDLSSIHSTLLKTRIRPSTAPPKRSRSATGNSTRTSVMERAQYFGKLCDKLETLGESKKTSKQQSMLAEPPYKSRPFSAHTGTESRHQIHPCLKSRSVYRLSSPGPQRGSMFISKGLGIIKQLGPNK